MEILLRKVLYSFLTIFLALSAIFFIIRLAPGDPVARILGENASYEEIAKYREQLGLHLPIAQQYVSYFVGMVKGDFGDSLFKKQKIFDLLTTHMTPTVILAVVSIFFSTLIGIWGGIISGLNKTTKVDNIFRVISLMALSFPIFSLAPVLVLIFSIKLGFLPVSEWGDISHSILPIMTLVIPLSAVILRVTRNKYLEESHAPWITVLRAKGLTDFGINARITKICLPTILNVVAIQLSVVLAGTMITETIFDIPGMGSLLFEGIQNRDYPVVQGIVAYSTVIYMVVYFIIDYVNVIIDPRMNNEV